MKKLLSLMLALVLCLGCMIPAMAEEPAATVNSAFTFTLDSYKEMYDMLAPSTLPVPYEWTTDELTGNAVITAEGYPDVVITADENGCVTSLTITGMATVNEMSDKASAFGGSVALTGMTAVALEDPAQLGAFVDEILTLIINAVSALDGEAAVADIACSTCAVRISLDMETQDISMEFIMVPLGTVIE